MSASATNLSPSTFQPIDCARNPPSRSDQQYGPFSPGKRAERCVTSLLSTRGKKVCLRTHRLLTPHVDRANAGNRRPATKKGNTKMWWQLNAAKTMKRYTTNGHAREWTCEVHNSLGWRCSSRCTRAGERREFAGENGKARLTIGN